MSNDTVNKPAAPPAGRPLYLWILALVVVANLVLLVVFWPRNSSSDSTPAPAGSNAQPSATAPAANAIRPFGRDVSRVVVSTEELSAEQVVSNKVSQFGHNRLQIVRALAAKHGLEVPTDVTRFFEAIESGDWTAADGLFKAWMRERRELRERDDNLAPSVPYELWPAITETFSVAETARNWPAQKLLDYGQSILGALRPGMVYIGGTDSGRYIPTLLNETSGGERHVVLTQNALADSSYLKYVEFLHGANLQMLDTQDSQRGFSDYLKDAQARLASGDLRPGEDVRVTDNRVQVSGQVAVMAINELLLQQLMQKNPDRSFALEESSSLPSTYANAMPLGPVLELRASAEPPGQPQITAAVDQWRSMAGNVSGESPDSDVRKTYAHMAQAQGNYFAARGFATEAEQTYQFVREMSPGSADAVGGLYRLWAGNGRWNEAEALLNDFTRQHPDQARAAAQIRATVPKTAAR